MRKFSFHLSNEEYLIISYALIQIQAGQMWSYKVNWYKNTLFCTKNFWTGKNRVDEKKFPIKTSGGTC